ncbi:hypothetical protein B9W14_03515 [Clostridium drakei]|uniref:Uncharacterized protein n=1 Tax=Clostridium drakei TaxID=332101 RepID=A0A2U8DLZ1_9CLOT|nr:hypothetical protein B9W14_03515 [Clostridium drakei]
MEYSYRVVAHNLVQNKNNNWLKDNPCILKALLKKVAAGFGINYRKAISVRKEALRKLKKYLNNL